MSEIRRVYDEIEPAFRDYPDRMVCHPGVLAMLGSGSEPAAGAIGGFGVQVHVDESMREHEWKLLRGERLLKHCFPNPFKEGEMIVFTPVDFMSIPVWGR
jgi:hypothetical protein